eukprot:Awhi_evm1s6880
MAKFAKLTIAAAQATALVNAQVPYFDQYLGLTQNPSFPIVAGFTSVPGIGYSFEYGLDVVPDPETGEPTIPRLDLRRGQLGQELLGYGTPITIAGTTLPVNAWGFGVKAKFDDVTQMKHFAHSPEDLDDTNPANNKFLEKLASYEAAFTDADVAEATFYESISETVAFSVHWLLKHSSKDLDRLQATFPDVDFVDFTALEPEDPQHATGPCRRKNGSSGKSGKDYTLHASKNYEECRQLCKTDNTCVAFEAKVNVNHNRCEIWHTLPAYAKTDADTHTCEIKVDDYYFLDTTDYQDLVPNVDETGAFDTRYSMGALTLLKMNESTKDLIPVAISITTTIDENNQQVSKMFTRENSSQTTWILAIQAAKSALINWIIPTGHILPYHIIPSAIQAAFYNVLPASHPLLEAMSPFMKYTAQFNALFFEAKVAASDGSPFPKKEGATYEFLYPFFKSWNQTMNEESFLTLRPSQFLESHGISGKVVKELKQNGFRAVRALEKLSLKFARKMVSSVYNTDADVANDPFLQGAVNYASVTGRLGQLTESGSVTTLEDLTEILTTYFYLSFSHGSARTSPLHQFSANPAVFSASFTKYDFLVEDTSAYTVNDILNHLVDTKMAFAHTTFIKFFTETDPYEALVSEDPLYNSGGENSDRLNNANEALENDISELIVNELKRDGFGTDDEELIDRIISQFPRNIES